MTTKTNEGRYKYICFHCNKEFYSNKKDQKFCCIGCGVSHRNFSYNDESFFKGKIDSEEKAYILGLFMADGSISEDKISITQNDKGLIEKIRDLINPNRKIYTRGKSNTFMWTNKEDLDFLKSIGITVNKSYDACIKLLEPKLMPHYIRGWFDGDGCIYKNTTIDKKRGYRNTYKQVSITSGSANAVISFLFFFELIGIKATYVLDSRCRKEERNNCWYIKINNQQDVNVFKHYIYDTMKTDLYLPKKYNRFYDIV